MFSIIIPTYNEQNDIIKTLDAISLQTFKNFEVIVVDDSDDNTYKIIKSYKKISVNLKERERIRISMYSLFSIMEEEDDYSA